MAWDWDTIEQQPGFAGMRARVEAEVRPVLDQVQTNPVDAGRQQKIVTRYFFGAFAAFVVMFIFADFTLPGGAFWEFFRFAIFPVLFFGNIALALFLARADLLKLFEEAQARLALRAEALRRITAPLGLTYVPAPGGAPKGLEWLAAQSWAPKAIRTAAATLNQNGGMDQAVLTVRDSGMLIPANTYVIGKPEQKRQYAEMAAQMHQMEDGFEGTRSGCAFSMFEWVESVKDAPDIYHLMIVLEAPFALHGLTQLRARKTSWPQDPDGTRVEEVDLGPKAFEAHYRLRSSDQVEARAIFNPAVIERVIELAHGAPFRAAARGRHIVFDFAGAENRFHLVNLVTGARSDEMLRTAVSDIAEALRLIETLAHAFMLARKSDTPAP